MSIYSTLKAPIGNMIDSNHQDITQTRRNFHDIGIEAGDKQNPFIDKPLDNAIRTFQKELGLKQDGVMNPKGETEQTLNLALAVKDNMPPLPQIKPWQNTQPLPEKKPLTLEKKRKELEENKVVWKDVWKKIKGVVKNAKEDADILKIIRKTPKAGPIPLLLELIEKAEENERGPI